MIVDERGSLEIFSSSAEKHWLVGFFECLNNHWRQPWQESREIIRAKDDDAIARRFVDEILEMRLTKELGRGS